MQTPHVWHGRNALVASVPRTFSVIHYVCKGGNPNHVAAIAYITVPAGANFKTIITLYTAHFQNGHRVSVMRHRGA